MHQGTYPLRRLWRQIDAIHGLRSEKRGKRNDVCPGGQTDSKPFKMTRVGIRPRQRKGVGAEWLFRHLNPDRSNKTFLAVHKRGQLKVSGRDDESPFSTAISSSGLVGRFPPCQAFA
jgi:hypothetical protein